MEVKMVIFWFALVLFIVGSQAAGKIGIIHSPPSLKFLGPSKTTESLLKEIFTACLGLSVDEDVEWDGLSIIDPFATPEAVVEIYVDGVSSIWNDAGVKSHVFPLYVDGFEPDTFKAIQQRILRYNSVGSQLVRIRLSDPNEFEYYSHVLGDIKASKVIKHNFQHLNYSVEEDYRFLAELEAVKAITSKVKSGVISADNIIDFYSFRFQTLHPLSDFHGPLSLKVIEGKQLLGEAIEELSKAFEKAYDGSVLVAAVTADATHAQRTARAAPSLETHRQRRQVTLEEMLRRDSSSFRSQTVWTDKENMPPATDNKDQKSKYLENNPTSYSDDYAAVFNIILWFGVVFAFSLVSIVYAIMDMDPGRDSIIYRMTSTRMKKDN